MEGKRERKKDREGNTEENRDKAEEVKTRKTNMKNLKGRIRKRMDRNEYKKRRRITNREDPVKEEKSIKQKYLKKIRRIHCEKNFALRLRNHLYRSHSAAREIKFSIVRGMQKYINKSEDQTGLRGSCSYYYD
ncbi:hypothetical protein PUN28_018680 [Cardiocondyla obscurior]|uniref:Ribosomal protein S14 n=1 Tax=Cardiocondyla obscurior TaxID=286306 RepID=A0AAW2EIW6_9HYME